MASHKRIGSRLLATLLTLAAAAPAYAQDEPTLVRGIINFARDGGMIGLVMEVLTPEQQPVYIYLSNGFKVVRIDPVPASQIVVGERVAIPSGGAQASVVWHLAEDDLSSDDAPWRLPDGTELVAGEVTRHEGDGIALSTPDGELSASVGAQTAFVATAEESGTMSLLMEGVPVVVVADRAQDGTLSTDRIYIGSEPALPL